MSNETVAVKTNDLKIGMYVAELDRPWLESPFLFQGFTIETEDDLNQLQDVCEYVHVDIEKGERPEDDIVHKPNSAPPAPEPKTRTIDFNAPAKQPDRKAPKTEAELPKAKAAFTTLSNASEEVLNAFRRGDKVEIAAISEAVEPVVDSVSRNPDAMLWLSRMRCKGEYAYQHSLRSSVLAVNYGRHLGLQREQLETLAIGGMLLDIGKTRIPDEILKKPGELTAQEYKVVREHVAHGVEQVGDVGGVDQNVIAMVQHHHERHDGSGYPTGISGETIPAFGKIAGIVDSYDAMTSVRGYGIVLSTHSALNHLNKERGKKFDAAVVEQFIQSLGIYPAGSLVELSDGTVGAVVEQNRRRRLKPRVLLILDCDKTPLREPRVIDLMLEKETQGQEPLHICGSLRAGKYGINPDDFFL